MSWGLRSSPRNHASFGPAWASAGSPAINRSGVGVELSVGGEHTGRSVLLIPQLEQQTRLGSSSLGIWLMTSAGNSCRVTRAARGRLSICRCRSPRRCRRGRAGPHLRRGTRMPGTRVFCVCASGMPCALMLSTHDQFGLRRPHCRPARHRRTAAHRRPLCAGSLRAEGPMSTSRHRAVVPLGAVRCDGSTHAAAAASRLPSAPVCGGALALSARFVPLMRNARYRGRAGRIFHPPCLRAVWWCSSSRVAALLRLLAMDCCACCAASSWSATSARRSAYLLRLRVRARIPFEHGAVVPAYMAFEHDALRACRVDEFDVVRPSTPMPFKLAHRVRIDGFACRVAVSTWFVDSSSTSTSDWANSATRHLQALALAAGGAWRTVGASRHRCRA